MRSTSWIAVLFVLSVVPGHGINSASHKYTLTVNSAMGGSVSSADGHINCGDICSFDYFPGNVVYLTANPDQGYTFNGWNGCDSAHLNFCVVTMNSDHAVSASFTPSLTSGGSVYPVTVSVMGSGIGIVTSSDGQINCQPYCMGQYANGTTFTLTAVAGWQSSFAGWTGCDSMQGNVCTINMGGSSRDVAAAFAGTFSGGLRFVPVSPCRLADTRGPSGTFGGPPISGNSSRDFPIPQGACGIPSNAMAYSLNVTVVPHGSLGYLTVWPAGLQQPYVSLMNSYDGRVKANAAIVPAGDAVHNEAVSVFATDTTDVVLDIDGYFVADDSSLEFYPVTPCRVLDTRYHNGPLGGPYISGKTSREFPVLSSNCNLPENSLAYSMNVTAVPHGTLGFLSIWPSDQQQPYVSTLNSYSGTAVANAAVVPAAHNGDISVYVSDDSDVVIDVNGYFAPASQNGLSFYPVTPCRVMDTRSTSGTFNGELTVNVAGSSCSLPLTIQAYVFNATVVPQGPLGFLALWPDGQSQPLVSTLNSYDGAVTSNMAIVPTGNGIIDSYASDMTDLILDISGYFAP